MNKDDRNELRELANKILNLTSDTSDTGEEDCEWFDRDEMSQDDLDRIKENGSDNNFNDRDGALLFRTMWHILKELKELRREVRLNGTPIGTPTSPLTSPDIQPYTPYTPYVPYKSTPNPLQIWYGTTTVPKFNPAAPVTCTYTDTEGHNFGIDLTKPASVAYTYQSAFAPNQYSVQSNANPLNR